MIRVATNEDVAKNMERILEIYKLARKFMADSGNLSQWAGAYPAAEDIIKDVQRGSFFIMEDDNGEIYAVFALVRGIEPTYAVIDGAWHYDTPYGTIHRVATDGSRSRVFDEVAGYAKSEYNHLRIDTHEDNKTMQQAILRNGFDYTGIVHMADGSPRLAYDWLDK